MYGEFVRFNSYFTLCICNILYSVIYPSFTSQVSKSLYSSYYCIDYYVRYSRTNHLKHFSPKRNQSLQMTHTDNTNTFGKPQYNNDYMLLYINTCKIRLSSQQYSEIHNGYGISIFVEPHQFLLLEHINTHEMKRHGEFRGAHCFWRIAKLASDNIDFVYVRKHSEMKCEEF